MSLYIYIYYSKLPVGLYLIRGTHSLIEHMCQKVRQYGMLDTDDEWQEDQDDR